MSFLFVCVWRNVEFYPGMIHVTPTCLEHRLDKLYLHVSAMTENNRKNISIHVVLFYGTVLD